jgi:hypothetical protein
MGFFSWDCKGCGESIKAPYGIPKDKEFQNMAISISEAGNIHRGKYDGYGYLGASDLTMQMDKMELWHEECWKGAGQPMKFTGESKYSDDQGFFYDKGDDGVIDE